MGAVDDAEDDDAPHFHFLKKAGIEAADSGKIRAVLAECWRALSINISDGNNKKKPRTTEFIHLGRFCARGETDSIGTSSLLWRIMDRDQREYHQDVGSTWLVSCRNSPAPARDIAFVLHVAAAI